MNDNREFFRETTDRILQHVLDPSDISAASSRKLPLGLFDALAENGILAMLAPEQAGGIGASLPEAMTVLRAAGDAAAPGPVLETMLANALLGRAGMQLEDRPVSLAFLPDGLPDDDTPLVIDLPWAGLVDQILLVIPSNAGIEVVVTPPASWQISAGEDAAGEPFDRVTAGGDITASRVPVDLRFDEVLRQASLLRAGQMLGAMEWAYRRSVEYAMERQQFGREIGRFQVVQQMLAELAGHLLAATVLLEAAAESDSMMMAGGARSRVADATDCAISVAHQVHGAIGFSLEYALNHRTRRLMAWRDTYGSVPFWRQSVGQGLAVCNRETLWHSLTATAPAD